MLCIRNLSEHSYSQKRESVVPIENLRNDQPVMSWISGEPGQAVFVMYRFDGISQTDFKFLHHYICKMPYSSHG